MKRLPSLFISHGAPTFAIEPGLAGPKLTALGQTLPRPAAVLVISPHWITREPRVTTTARPRTIHDFGGFDPALYEITYAVDGHPQLAARTIEVLRSAGWNADGDGNRGLDHGAWVPLLHLYPQADVPTYQVSMPARLEGQTAYEFGQALAPLAEENVLIIGSGGLTHNLNDYREDHGREETYAVEFAAWIRDAIRRGDRNRLIHAMDSAPHARRAHPTIEHFLPLVIAAGAAAQPLQTSVIDGGVVHGAFAMDSFVFG